VRLGLQQTKSKAVCIDRQRIVRTGSRAPRLRPPRRAAHNDRRVISFSKRGGLQAYLESKLLSCSFWFASVQCPQRSVLHRRHFGGIYKYCYSSATPLLDVQTHVQAMPFLRFNDARYSPLGCSLRPNVKTVFLIFSYANRCVLRHRCARLFCCLLVAQILKLRLRDFVHLEVIPR
jgi:hypothetical protein